MEHRPLPHHSPAIRRYVHEIDSCLYARISAANGSDRERFYVDYHEPQLHTVQQEVSRREPSEVERFPFLCVFHFAGCDQKFANKRDWKDHVVSQHLKLDRVFWECSEGRCRHSKLPRPQRRFITSKTFLSKDNNGKLFADKHDFRTHLISCHRLTKPHDKKEYGNKVLNKEVQWLLDRQDSSMRMRCRLPQDLGCPMPQCASVRFTGPSAWDQRLSHAAEHFLARPQCLDVFGGENDAALVQWASSDKVGIHQITPNTCLKRHGCDKSIADSGYSSMPGMPQQPNMSQHGDSSPVVPSEVPGLTSDATLYDHGTETFSLSADSAGIGGWARVRKYLQPIIDQESNSSACQSSQQPFSQHESIDDHETLGTSQDSDSSDESDGSPETAAVMKWFHGWLREWLSPLIQERPSGNGNGSGSSQNTASQNQAGSGSSTQKKQGTTRPRRAPKGKRGKDGEDDGNEETPKSQRVDQDPRIRMLACPFYKRNPHTYGQPKWKSCAHPGFPDIRRVKEHVYRRHSLPEYQCRRCRVDQKTSEALEAHSQQLQACTPCIGNQDGLSQDQLKKMRSKKGAGKNKSQEDRWNDVYSIAFPYDQQTPRSPYLYDTDGDENAREFNRCDEFCRFLTRELPTLVRRRLSTAGCPLPETIKDDIEQYVKRLVPRLQSSFLEEVGLATGESSEQLDVASTTNDGASFVESTMSRHTSQESATTLQQDSSTSEHPMATFPKGSTSQESMAMMPQVGYDMANSTMFQDGNFSGQGIMLPAYFSTTDHDWQAIYQQLGYDANNTLEFGTS